MAPVRNGRDAENDDDSDSDEGEGELLSVDPSLCASVGVSLTTDCFRRVLNASAGKSRSRSQKPGVCADSSLRAWSLQEPHIVGDIVPVACCAANLRRYKIVEEVKKLYGKSQKIVINVFPGMLTPNARSSVLTTHPSRVP